MWILEYGHQWVDHSKIAALFLVLLYNGARMQAHVVLVLVEARGEAKASNRMPSSCLKDMSSVPFTVLSTKVPWLV